METLDRATLAMPQTGIFALGDAAHIYLELSACAGVSRTTVDGVNVVIGFRPELWQAVAAHDAPAGLTGLTSRWPEARAFACRRPRPISLFGSPGLRTTSYSISLEEHDSKAWEALAVSDQERVIGRSKAESIELPEEVQPETSHVSRTTVEIHGSEQKIFRRNTAYGNAVAHGTIFVGFSQDRDRLESMLRRMAGADDGIRDALMRYATPLSGAYYFCPSLRALQSFAPQTDPA